MKNNSLKKALCVGILSAAVLFLVFSQQVRSSVTQALALSVGTVIPGLFPFLVLSDFACNTRLFTAGKRISKITDSLFGLPACCIPTFLFGLTGGFLTGTKVAVAQYKSGQITKEQAQQLCLFCFSPGLAFAVSAVGNGMLHASDTGILLFICSTLPCFLLGVIRRKTSNIFVSNAIPQATEKLIVVFTAAVQKSAQACLQLSAWMALFAALQAVILAILPQSWHSFFILFAEVSAGALLSANLANLPLCASVLGFGGFCIFCQLLPDLLEIDLSPTSFLRYRLAQACLSWIFCKIGLFFFPHLGLSKTTVLLRAYSVNPTASVFLLLACFIFVLDLAPTQKTWYTQYGR